MLHRPGSSSSQSSGQPRPPSPSPGLRTLGWPSAMATGSTQPGRPLSRPLSPPSARLSRRRQRQRWQRRRRQRRASTEAAATLAMVACLVGMGRPQGAQGSQQVDGLDGAVAGQDRLPEQEQEQEPLTRGPGCCEVVAGASRRVVGGRPALSTCALQHRRHDQCMHAHCAAGSPRSSPVRGRVGSPSAARSSRPVSPWRQTLVAAKRSPNRALTEAAAGHSLRGGSEPASPLPAHCHGPSRHGQQRSRDRPPPLQSPGRSSVAADSDGWMPDSRGSPGSRGGGWRAGSVPPPVPLTAVESAEANPQVGSGRAVADSDGESTLAGGRVRWGYPARRAAEEVLRLQPAAALRATRAQLKCCREWSTACCCCG